MGAVVRLSMDEAMRLCVGAAMAKGASDEVAHSLAASVVQPEAEGQASVGLAHFIDYLEALEAGRIDGHAVPSITQPVATVIVSDAGGGAAHPGFDRAFDDIVATAQKLGLCLFLQRNAFTCGALGAFAKRLADRGLVALAATNGPALLAGSGGTKPVYCTNPMAFAAPCEGAPPLLIDQSSSATAFVNIRAAAERGEQIPAGWALDADGKPTTDAKAAVTGTLLAFGGARGANIALMVEVLSAGLSGANWSVDAPSFGSGSECPGTGLFVLAIDPKIFEPDFATRVGDHARRLSSEYGVHIPGPAKARAEADARRDGLAVDRAVHARIVLAAATGKQAD